MMSNNAFAAQTCIVGAVETNKCNMTLYFPQAGNSNGSIADMCSDVAGLSSSSSSYIPFGFECGHNSHTVFYVIMVTVVSSENPFAWNRFTWTESRFAENRNLTRQLM